VGPQFIGFRSLAGVRGYYAALARDAGEKPRMVLLRGKPAVRFAYKAGDSPTHWVTYLDPHTGLPLESAGNNTLYRYNVSILPPGRLPGGFFATPT